MAPQVKEESAPKENIKKVEKTAKVRNYVRVRPFMSSEEKANAKDKVSTHYSSVELKDDEVHVLQPIADGALAHAAAKAKAAAARVSSHVHTGEEPKIKKKYGGFDKAFWSFGEDQEGDDWPYMPHTNQTNEDVYNEVKGDIIQNVFDGYNQAVVTYGPINAGKTHTMYGNSEDEGLVQRFLRDITARIPDEVKARQAPEETLVITTEVQAVRIYKEEIEDAFDRCKTVQPEGTAHYEVGKKLSGENDFDKIAAGLWGKDGVRSTSTITTPNKHNRSAVVVRITVKHNSTIESDGPEKVQSSKEAILTLAEMGAGPKADKESVVEYKKINQASEAFKSLLMRMKDGKGKKKHFLPFGQSASTRHLAQAIGESHVSMILCVGPHHKATSMNELFLSLASDLQGVESTATVGVSEDLRELREQLQAKRENELQIVKSRGAQDKVKNELERMALLLRDEKNKKKELEADCENTEADIEAEKRTQAKIGAEIVTTREVSKLVHVSLDTREKVANENLAKATETMEGMPEEIDQMDKDLKDITNTNDAIAKKFNDFEGLQVMFGVEQAKATETTQEDIAEAKQLTVADVRDRQKTAQEKVTSATTRLQNAVQMDKESTDLLQKVSKSISAENEVTGKIDNASRDTARAKRRYMREIAEAMEATKKGLLGDVIALTPEEDKDEKDMTEAERFYTEESKHLANVLLGEEEEESEEAPKEQILAAPGWCSFDKVEPVGVFVHKHFNVEGLANMTSGGGSTASIGLAIDIDSVTFESLETNSAIVSDAAAWCHKILQYARNRKAVENAYAEWLQRMPSWPQAATRCMQLIAERDRLNKEAEALEKETADLIKNEVEPEERNLDAANKDIKAKEIQYQSKNVELKKAVDSCNCTIL